MSFDESKHPRDNGGKFTDGNGEVDSLPSASKVAATIPKKAWERQDVPSPEGIEEPKYGTQEELDELLGEEFSGYKGQAAVDKLLEEQRGHVKGAFHREDIGDIDLIWGNMDVGLCHAIEQRQKEKNGNEHARDMLNHLVNAVNKGIFDNQSDRGDFTFVYEEDDKKYFVIIAPAYHGNKITYLLTSYSRRIKKK